jgi:polyphosphate kinase
VRARKILGYDPVAVLEQVRQGVLELSAEYDATYDEILRQLATAGIELVPCDGLSPAERDWVRDLFRRRIRAQIAPLLLANRQRIPDLPTGSLQLLVRMSDSAGRRKPRHALIELPARLPRFHVLPGGGRRTRVILVDEIVRLELPSIFALFKHDIHEAWAIRLTRDAELDVDDDFSMSWSAKLSAGLKKRERGLPVRLVYDATLPPEMLKLAMRKLAITKQDTLMPGGRHLRRSDFIQFPEVGGRRLRYPPALVVPHGELPADGSLLASIRKGDRLLHVPYNPFAQFIDLLREAALDPKVKSIRITLYRLARNSHVILSLIAARRNGKQVTAVVELQARFDEEANIHWAERLKAAGVEVVFGVPGLKVHSKLLLIERLEAKGGGLYAVVGTGNFNEESAAVFEDMLLMTADRRITREVAMLFNFFRKSYLQLKFQHLLVSPWITRERVAQGIDAEIAAARKGRPAALDFKLNHLADSALIAQLTRAAEAGVAVRLNVRGMFSLLPGQVREGRPIEAMAVIDRYLEHSRLMRFERGGKPLLVLGSGDLMPRNLDRRVEVFAPVYDERIRRYIEQVLELHWADEASARILDDKQRNRRRGEGRRGGLRVQQEIARLNRQLHGTPEDTP